MSRVVQPRAKRGSQRWVQEFVNNAPGVLDLAIGLGGIRWVSPRSDDGFAEYRDEAFLARLGVELRRRPLGTFWPRLGPQWDALGIAASGEAVLVEAKSHIGELFSSPTRAAGGSARLIRASLAETAASLGARPLADAWGGSLYQYANRLAHAHLLSRLNRVRARLVFLYFVGDRDMRGPETRAEWEAALQVVHGVLGLRRLPGHVSRAFVEVGGAGVAAGA
jgi:hypothetical protein